MSRPLDEAKHRQANDVDDDDEMDDDNAAMCRFPAVLPPIPRVSSLTEALIVPLLRQCHGYNSVRFVAYSIHPEFCGMACVIFRIFVGTLRITSILRPSKCSDRVWMTKNRKRELVPLFTCRRVQAKKIL